MPITDSYVAGQQHLFSTLVAGMGDEVKYLKMEITREQSTEIYVEVPDDFDYRQWRSAGFEFNRQIKEISDSTVSNMDWQSDSLIGIESVDEVDASEATQYEVGKIDVHKLQDEQDRFAAIRASRDNA